MIQHLLLVSGVSSLAVGSFHILKMRRFVRLFDRAEAITQLFNFSHLEGVADLPLNTDILLAGKAQTDNDQPNVLVVKRPRQSTNQIWFIKQFFKFNLSSKKDQKLQVESRPETLIFNLKDIGSSQIGLKKDSSIAMIGRVKASPNGHVFDAQMLLGQNQQAFLKSLDAKILYLLKLGRIFTITGIVILCVHALYKNYYTKKLPE